MVVMVVSTGIHLVLLAVFLSGSVMVAGAQRSPSITADGAGASNGRCHPHAVVATMHYVERDHDGRPVHRQSTLCGPIHTLPAKQEGRPLRQSPGVRP
jgi:hypothetical protein